MERKDIIVLKYALAREIEGRDFYKSRAERVSNKSLKDTLIQLAEMEEDHVKFLLDLLGNEKIDIPTQVVGSSEFVMREQEEIQDLKMMTDLSVLRMAYLIEHDFATFYEDMARNTLDENMKKALMELAHWEKQHRDMLKNLYDELFKQFWSEQGFYPVF